MADDLKFKQLRLEEREEELIKRELELLRKEEELARRQGLSPTKTEKPTTPLVPQADEPKREAVKNVPHSFSC